MSLFKANTNASNSRNLAPDDILGILTTLGLENVIKTLVAGNNISIDDSDPENPIIHIVDVSIDWGQIGGDILNQSDLISLLSAKSDNVTKNEGVAHDAGTVSGTFSFNVTEYDSVKCILIGNTTLNIINDLEENTNKVISLTVTTNSGEELNLPGTWVIYGVFFPNARNKLTINFSKYGSTSSVVCFINQPN